MGFLQILGIILEVAPEGITLVKETVELIGAIADMFSSGQVSAQNQTTVSTALAKHLAKVTPAKAS